MRVVVRGFSLGIVLSIGIVQAASADPVLVTDHRSLASLAQLNAQAPIIVLETPLAPFVTFDRVATATATAGRLSAQTTATQLSMLSARLFSASGAIESSATVPDNLESFAFASGSSTFEIEFDLPTPHRFALTGLIAVNRIEQTDGFGEVEVSLGNESSSGVIEVVDGDDIRFGSHHLNFTGILPAGRHRLFAEASTESVVNQGLSRHASSFDFDFALTPTPEPGSVLLLGGGLLAFASMRLRSRLSLGFWGPTGRARRLLLQACAIAGGVLFVAPASAGADSIIFSNLDPGGTYDGGTAYNVSGPFSQAEEATAIGQPFVPAASYEFDSVEVALNWLLDTNAGTIALMSDMGGRPGSIIESFQFTDRPHFSSTSTELALGVSLLHPLLLARTQYWIVGTAGGDAYMVWNLNNTGQLGTAIQINGGNWTSRLDLSSGAFRVRGSRVEDVVPEPTSILLLGTAAVGLIARRRGRKPAL